MILSPCQGTLRLNRRQLQKEKKRKETSSWVARFVSMQFKGVREKRMISSNVIKQKESGHLEVQIQWSITGWGKKRRRAASVVGNSIVRLQG